MKVCWLCGYKIILSGTKIVVNGKVKTVHRQCAESRALFRKTLHENNYNLYFNF